MMLMLVRFVHWTIIKNQIKSNFPLKLLRATVANTNTGSPKTLHTLFDTYVDYMLAKLKPKRIVRNIQKINF